MLIAPSVRSHFFTLHCSLQHFVSHLNVIARFFTLLEGAVLKAKAVSLWNSLFVLTLQVKTNV